MTRLPETAHTAQPWRIHELAPDFAVEDVWALPTPGGPDDFPRLVELVSAGDPARGSSRVVAALFALRWKIGALLGWDDEKAGLDARVPTLRDRLPADLRDGPTGPAADALPFVPLYLTGDEWAAEIANRTMHGVMHLGWVADGAAVPRADGRPGQAQRPDGRRVHGRDQAVPAPHRLPADAPRARAPVAGARLTQADRRARSRAALLEATARGLSRAGYGDLVLDAVAAEAGYTRGALYHQFRDKEALALATLEWVHETWYAEVGSRVRRGPRARRRARGARAPPRRLLPPRHRRRDGRGARRVRRARPSARPRRARARWRARRARAARLIEDGRADGTIPAGPAARALALASLRAIEGAVIALAGNAGEDEEVAERIVRGLLGV